MAKQTFTTGQVLTAAQMTSLQQTAMGGGSTTAKTASYVLVAADAGTVVQMNSASATTITVNTALFAAGDTVTIQNVGAGVCTVTAGTATVSTSATLALKQYDAGSLYFNSTSAAIFFAVDAADGMTNPFTTTGDTVYASGGTTPTRLGIGSTGQVLTVASGIPSWATPASGGGMTLLSTTSTTTGSAYTISSIDQNYNHLQIVWQGLSCTSGANITLTFGGGTTATGGVNQDATTIATLDAAAKLMPDTQANTNAIMCNIFNYTYAGAKNLQIAFGGVSAGWRGGGYQGFTNYNSAVSSITVTISTGSFSAGSLKLYGVK